MYLFIYLPIYLFIHVFMYSFIYRSIYVFILWGGIPLKLQASFISFLYLCIYAIMYL